MNAADHRRAAADRTLPLRARGDLQSSEVAFGGQASFVVKDPVAGESFHLSAEEHRLLAALRQPTSLRRLQRIVDTEFAPRRASIPQLQQFVNSLYDQGLLVSEAPGQGAELLARGRDRRRKSRWASLLQVLSIRLVGFRAGPFVDKLYAAAGWLCSPWAVALAIGLVIYAALVAIADAPALAARLPAARDLVALHRLPLWIAAIAGVKALHELGHALACRRFGAQPQEMGILLLAGGPALYCDVSDAWRLPSKWRRMAVAGAGMFVELVIAAVAVLAWRHAEPGLLSSLCLSVIVVCTVGTLAVNANPLVRFDGYYLLADWLEVPNLAERARGVASSAWRRWLLGERPQSDPFVPPGKRRALWAYALLSKAYVAVMLTGLLVLGVRIAKPHGLENLVYAVAAIAVAGLLLQPALAVARLARDPGLRSRLRRGRAAGTIAAVAAAAIALWFVPMRRRVEAPLVAVPATAHPLFAVAGGELREAAAEGAWVEPGDVVARLSNPDLELALAEKQGQVRESRLRLDQLRTLQAMQPAAARMIPSAEAELAAAEGQLAEQQRMADALVIRAPAAGRVLAPPPRARESLADGMLQRWSGSPLETRNRGAWIDPGTPLAVVATPGGWVAWAGVDQADTPAVEVGQPARLVLDERPAAIYEAHVAAVRRRARDNHSAHLAAASDRSRRDAEFLGDDRYHVVELALDDPPAELFAGARGTVKITAAESTLGKLAWLHVRRAFARAF
jgi:putative peptide zinc metalloprotease protein